MLLPARRARLVLLPLLLFTVAAFSSESWSRKIYLEWTEEEALTVLTDSPWSKPWLARAPVSRGTGNPPAASGPETSGEHSNCCRSFGSGVDSGASDPRHTPAGPGQAGPSALSRPAEFYRILWFSSMHVRQAVYRLRLLSGEERNPATEEMLQKPADRIIIALSGPDLTSFQKVGLSHMQKSTHLQTKKGKRKAELVDFIPPETRPDRLALFIFARTIGNEPVFSPGDSELQFVTETGRHRITVWFRVREMSAGGNFDF